MKKLYMSLTSIYGQRFRIKTKQQWRRELQITSKEFDGLVSEGYFK